MSQLRGSTRNPGASDATALVTIQYEPIAEIGSGGMGTVALARATTGPKAGSFVAIKRIYPHLEKEPAVIDAFLDEVWLTSSLHHPNVVEPLDWGRNELGSFLVMQFVPSDSLRAVIRAREAAQAPIPIEIVVEILTQSAEGLQAAHELKGDDGSSLDLVHRDVSPANILIGFDGSVKLIDFGVAKAARKLAKTESGLIKGKYSYMSPEQIQGRALDRRSDIFALGVVAWEVLTLCRLYDAATEFDILRMVSEEVPLAPSELRADVPQAIDRVVLKCLEKSPDARYSTCSELIRELTPYRPAAGRAKELVAKLAREALPERLAWIERMTGTAPEIGIAPMAIAADVTMESGPMGDRTAENVVEVAAGPPDTSPLVSPPTHEYRSQDTQTVRDSPAASLSSNVDPPSGVEVVAKRLSEAWQSPASIRARKAARENALMLGILGAIAVFATLIGAWLGAR